MFDFLQFAMSALQNPDLMANQMTQMGLTPEMMQNQLGQLAQPMQEQIDIGPKVPPIGSETQVAQAGAGVQPSVFTRFMQRVSQDVQNPYGLAAVAATGKRESGFSPNNANRTWDDLGQPAGGIMSWRGERLPKDISNMSPEQQAEYLLAEDPQLIEALNRATSADEAQQAMNNAWRFKGYDNPDHPETQARYGLANEYSNLFNSANLGSTIDFARAEGATGTPPLTGGGVSSATTSATGSQISGTTNPVTNAGPKSLGDKLAQIGSGLVKSGALKDSGAREKDRPPQLAGLQPQVGGGFNRNPQAIEQMMALLGSAGPTSQAIPSLAAMIRGGR